MLGTDEYFVRDFDLDVLDITLKLHQKMEGDVGCVVWDASIVLAKYLEELYSKNPDYFKNLNVIELGSGVGCVGLTASSLGANVLLTDLPEILPIVQKNVELNKESLHHSSGKAQVSSLPWGQKFDFEQKPDLILFADCVYYQEAIEALISTLRDLSGPRTKILFTQELRETEKQQDCWKLFFESIKKYFKYHFVPLEEQNETFRSRDILLIELLPL